MIDQRDNFLWFKLNGLIRQMIVRGVFAPFGTHYTVNEYPKSGGTWLGQMLSEGLEIPFPRNRLPMLCSSVMHGHYLNPSRMKNVIVLWRDGRDVIVSHYYHSLFVQEELNPRKVRIARRHLEFRDYGDIRQNLPRFIEYAFEQKVRPRFSWSDFVRNWADRDVVQVKYEQLRKDTACELRRVIRELAGQEIDEEKLNLIVEKYSFENQSGRKPGQEKTNSFLRKGIVGDWKNHFTRESRRLFSQYAGEELIMLGYEKDYSWAE